MPPICWWLAILSLRRGPDSTWGASRRRCRPSIAVASCDRGARRQSGAVPARRRSSRIAALPAAASAGASVGHRHSPIAAAGSGAALGPRPRRCRLHRRAWALPGQPGLLKHAPNSKSAGNCRTIETRTLEPTHDTDGNPQDGTGRRCGLRREKRRRHKGSAAGSRGLGLHRFFPDHQLGQRPAVAGHRRRD